MLGKLVRPALGRRAFQPLWERLHRIALLGMNIGTATDVGDVGGEIWAMGAVIRRLPPDREAIVFDVGANVGEYAAHLLPQLGGRGQVYCFEPSPVAFARLSDRFSNRPDVRLLNYGLGERDETVPLYADAAGSEMASVHRRRLDYLGIAMDPREQAQLRTLTACCADLGVGRIDLLKLDVEGHELAVLVGARPLLDVGAIGHIQFEFGGADIDSRTYFRDFWELLHPQYHLHRILRDGLAPIDHYDERLEIFTLTNYLAIRR